MPLQAVLNGLSTGGRGYFFLVFFFIVINWLGYYSTLSYECLAFVSVRMFSVYLPQ